MMQLVEKRRAPHPLIADGDISLFAEWLAEQGSRAVGVPTSPHRCPLANWLRCRFGTDTVVVGYGGAFIGTMGHDIPAWMTRFQEEACDMLRLDRDGTPSGVRFWSGHDCLAIVRGIEEELAATAT